jgi:hypothetical protein
MLNTVEFFDLIKERLQLPSDYALAKKLEISPQSVSLHRKKPHGMDSGLALRVAELSNLPPEYVLSCAAAERAKCTEEKHAWMRVSMFLELRLKELDQLVVAR